MTSNTKINYIAKDLLAKLLATENITIQHKYTSSAAFDVKNRVLILPIYKDMTESIYDMFIGHECGHSLHTPSNSHDIIKTRCEQYKKYFICCNILEDARVDKLMKRKFPGLAKSYYYAGKELVETNRLGLKGRDINTLSLIDRINVYFKYGILNAADVHFTEEEKQYVRETEQAETFMDIVAVCDKIVARMQKEKKDKKKEDKKEEKKEDKKPGQSQPKPQPQEQGEKEQSLFDDPEDGQENDDSNSQGTEDDETESADGTTETKEAGKNKSEAEPDDSKTNKSSATAGSSDDQDEEVGVTQENEQTNFDKFLADNPYHQDPIYVELPDIKKIKLEEYIIDYKELHKGITDFYSTREVIKNYAGRHFLEFKNKTSPTVSYLVKEFEIKKSAEEFARTQVSKTGMIDTNRIHSYQYNDDIFLKRETVKDGKNHGLVMFIDCSGSMRKSISDTFEQLINLVMFCRKSNIPFEVYGFSDYHYNRTRSLDHVRPKSLEVENFVLKNYFSSRMTATEFHAACINIYAIIDYYRMGGYQDDGYSIPQTEKLNGTPLNSAIICAMKLVPEFRTKYNLQKVTTIFLTDGESNSLHYNYGNDSNYSGGIMTNGILRNQYTRKEYQIDNSLISATAALYNCFRDITKSNIVGFYLESDMYNVNRLLSLADQNEQVKKDENQNTYTIKNSFGYDELYVILTTSLKFNEQAVVVQSKSQNSRAIAKAFTEVLKNKIQNRVILSKFIEQIA